MEIEAVDIDFSYRLKKLDIKEGCFFCPNNSCEDPTITRKKNNKCAHCKKELYYNCYCGKCVSRQTYYKSHKDHLNFSIIDSRSFGIHKIEIASINNINMVYMNSIITAPTNRSIEHNGKVYYNIKDAVKLLADSKSDLKEIMYDYVASSINNFINYAVTRHEAIEKRQYVYIFKYKS